MTILDVLRHQWTRQWRATTWGRTLVATIFLAIAAVYFGILFVGLGWFYPDIVAEVAPDRDPLRLLNASLLYGAVGLIVGRFFLQRSVGSAVQSYRPLPIRDGQLVRLLQVTSALSLFNLLPVVVLAALWGSTVWPAATPADAALWAVGALLTVALTQFANSLLRVAWDRNASLLLGGAAVLVLFVLATNAVGGGGLWAASSWLFGGLGAGAVGPLIVLGVATGGVGWSAHRVLRARLYDVVDRASESGSGILPRTGLLGRRWGPTRPVSLALLDVKLILRNKRPWQALLFGFGFIGIVALNLLVQEPGGALGQMNHSIYSYILTGFLGLQYGSFGYGWHGHHYDQLLVRTVSPQTLVRTQSLILCGLCLASFLVALPVVGVVRPSLILPLCGFLVYNLGVTVPAMIFIGVWRREAIALREGAMFNYQGTSSGSFAFGAGVSVLVMGLPIGLAFSTGLQVTLVVVVGLGLLGIALAPVWTRALGALFWDQRHAMAAGFRDTD